MKVVPGKLNESRDGLALSARQHTLQNVGMLLHLVLNGGCDGLVLLQVCYLNVLKL